MVFLAALYAIVATYVSEGAVLSESSALLEFKGGCKNPAVLDTWSGLVCDSKSMPSWRGVTCNNSQVTRLDLAEYGLNGPLPASWSVLSGLNELLMSSNNLTGTLPTVWGTNMVNLAHADFSGNKITGFLPAAWSQMRRLSYLSLLDNQLSGSLPGAWSGMQALSMLYLYGNKLTGTLPTEWGVMPLSDCRLGLNRLTGTLPSSWVSPNSALAQSLVDGLDLSFNKLEGSIPQPVAQRLLVSDFTGGISAKVVLDPMTPGYGLCGAIPYQMNVTSETLLPGNRASHTLLLANMPRGACSGSPAPLSRSNIGVIVGGTMGAATISALVLAACVVVRRRQTRQNDRQQGASAKASKLAGKKRFSQNSKDLPSEANDKHDKALAALNKARVQSPKPMCSATDAGLHKPAVSPDAAIITVSDQLDSAHSPWEGDQVLQQPPLESADSRHSPANVCSLSPSGTEVSEPKSIDILMDTQGKGIVLSLPKTMQPRPGRAARLCDSATSKKGPVQVATPTAGTDACGGVKSFATEAWHQSTELIQAAGSGVSEQTTPPPERQSAELDDMWKLKEGSVTLCLDSEGKPVKLGQGGYGSVYLGKLRRSHSVAIKMVEVSTDRHRLRFIREICLLRECRDPNIVRFWGAQILQESMLLVMEYCAGGDLYHVMLRDYTDDYRWYKRGMRIALDIIHGLDYLHSQDIAHLDLKSPNILIDRDGTAKIADVGLSKLVGTREATATSAGSLLWAAPEQIEMKACGTKADIWAFGTILWEICTGEQLVTRHQQCSGISSLPGEVLDMIGQCHQTTPAARPTAIALKDRLLSMTGMSP